MSPPRAIAGNVGNRIRVIFGETGSEWLLLLDEDDGDMQWQSHYWKGIPRKLATQLNNCTRKGRYVRDVDFGNNGNWFVTGIKRDGSGCHSWWHGAMNEDVMKQMVGGSHRVRVSFGKDAHGVTTEVLLNGRNGYFTTGNVHDSLSSRMKRINSRKKSVNFVRLFDHHSYFISDSEGTEWLGMGLHCNKELKKQDAIKDIAVATDGSWLIIRPNTFTASTGVDEDLTEHLIRFFREQKKRNSERGRQIREYNESIRRESEEREARERAEREARERAERLAREVAEQGERERVEREAREAQARRHAAELEKARKVESLESMLEERLQEESRAIQELEEHLRKRKRSLRASLESMSPARRARIQIRVVLSSNEAECCVCHAATASRAVVPCGHQCLCDECSSILSASSLEARLCPICRGNLQSTLKIYVSRHSRSENNHSIS